MRNHQPLRYLSAVLIVCGMLAPLSFAAEDVYYQWYDEAGKLNVSDQRPKTGVQYQTVKSKSIRASSDQSSGGGLTRQVNKAVAEKQREEIKKQGEAINEKARQNNCDIATEELRVITNSARVREIGTDGEYRYLTDEEKAQRGERAKKNMELYCNGESEE